MTRRNLDLHLFVPLAGFVLPTVVIGYGVVIPRSCIAGCVLQPERAGEAVLEVGCGHGRTLARLAKTPRAHLAGIDPSEVMVRLARKRMRTWIDAESGFVEIHSIERSIGRVRFTYAEARRPGLYQGPVDSSAEAEVGS